MSFYVRKFLMKVFFHNHLHVYFSICMYEMSERRRENSKEVLWM